MRREHVNAVLVLSSGILNKNREQVIRLAMRNKWPTLATMRAYPESDGLMSYAPSWLDSCRRAATYVDISKHAGRVNDESILVDEIAA
jgi:hypothetical protein